VTKDETGRVPIPILQWDASRGSHGVTVVAADAVRTPSPDGAHRCDLAEDGEPRDVVVYCPACAELEFGNPLAAGFGHD
jgi:hypothetical protein